MGKNTAVFFDVPCFSVGGVESFAINAGLSLVGTGVYPGLIESKKQRELSNEKIEEISTTLPVLGIDRFFERVESSEDNFVLVLSWNIEVYRACANKISEKHSNLRVISYIHNDALYYYDRAISYQSIISSYICVSEIIQEKLQSLIPERKEDILYTPCPTAIYSEKGKSQVADLRVTFVGRIEDGAKGVFRLPEIYLKLKKLGIPIDLKIIGTGPDLEELKQQFQTEKEASKVTFITTAKTPQDVQEYLEESDILLVTSNYEGGPLVVYEAMACKVVPVSFNVGNVRKIINHGKNGFMHQVGDIDEMTNSIAKLHFDRNLLKEFSDVAYKDIKEKGYLQSEYNKFLLHEIQRITNRSANHNPKKVYDLLAERRKNYKAWIENLCSPEIIRRFQIISYLNEYEGIIRDEFEIDNFSINEIRQMKETVEFHKNTYETLPLWWKKIGALIRKTTR